MNTRWKIALALLLAILAAWLVVRLTQTPELSYQGKTISEWLDDWSSHKQTGYDTAIEAIGTNALPCVVRYLVRYDSGFNSTYRKVYPDLRKFLQNILPRPTPLLESHEGATAFWLIGSNAVPHVIALLKHPSRTVREAAVMGLGELRKKTTTANQAIPALIEALEDKELYFFVAMSIAEMGAAASNAVPALTKVLADTHVTEVDPKTDAFYRRRAYTAQALGKIGPTAVNALPALKAALQEPESNLRGQAAAAIWRINEDVDTALPVLLREMPGTGRPFKQDWITAIGEMGPRAKAAVPLLQSQLEKSKVKWFREHITNALNRIDPDHLGKAGQESRPTP